LIVIKFFVDYIYRLKKLGLFSQIIFLSSMDNTGRNPRRLTIPDPLNIGTVKANLVEAKTVDANEVIGDVVRTQNYTLPSDNGTQGQVLTADTSGNVQWEDQNAQPSQDGDIVFFQTAELTGQFNPTGSPSSTDIDLAATLGAMGSLTLPADSVELGEVYTIDIGGKLTNDTSTDTQFSVSLYINNTLVDSSGTIFVRSGGIPTPYRARIPLHVYQIAGSIASVRANGRLETQDSFFRLDISPITIANHAFDSSVPVTLSVLMTLSGSEAGTVTATSDTYTLRKSFFGVLAPGQLFNQSLNTYDDVTHKDLTLDHSDTNYLRFSENGDVKWELEHESTSNQMIWRDDVGTEYMRMSQSGGTVGSLNINANTGFLQSVAVAKDDADSRFEFVNNGAGGTQWSIINRGADQDKLEITNLNNDKVLTLEQNGTVTIGNGAQAFSLPLTQGTPGQYLHSQGATTDWKLLPAKYVGGFSQFGGVTNTTFGAANTYTTVMGDSWVNGILSGFTVTGTFLQPTLTYNGENGRYLFLYVSVSWVDGGGAGSDDFAITIHRNNNLLPDTWITSRLDGTAVYPRAASTGCNALANTGDEFAVKIRNLTSANPCLISDITFSAHTI
jgi:hypothetical protein